MISYQEKVRALAAFGCALASLLLMKMSGFAVSSMVNFQNYIIKTGISETSGMSTISSISLFLAPFYFMFASLVFLAVSISLAAVSGKNYFLALLVGSLSAISALIIFRSLWSIFLAAALVVGFFAASRLLPVYFDEIKKWKEFRSGSHAASRALFFMNIIIVLGIFVVVLAGQQDYAVSFRSEMKEAFRAIIGSMPGVSALPQASISQMIDQAVDSSEIFNAYIRWLPLTTALGAWFLLELLRNIILSNIAGAVSYIFLKRK